METKVIEKENPAFPELLRQIPDAPKQLYYKGVWDESLFGHCLAVVGSRRMTNYGRRATEQVVGEVAAAGVTIVSGFMYGIDAAAHTIAVRHGRTIAVMPCGIERVHPEYQKDLYEKILETGGLIVSEWNGGGMPQMWMYPKRNRIVAGLCKTTLVVEAGLDSGSLITAEFARKFGRTLFAVPGPITSRVSEGTHRLIRQGATLASSAQDVLEHYGSKVQFSISDLQSNSNGTMSSTEQKILEALQRESLEADMLARTLQIPAAELGTTLSFMELRGVINQEGGKYYVN